MLDEEDDWAEVPEPEKLFANTRYASLLDRCRLREREANDFIEKCKEDKSAVESLLKALPSHDEKYDILEERLHTIVEGKREPYGVIVFTQYVDTANYLYNKLKKVFDKVVLVTGQGSFNYGGKSADEDEVVEAFQKKGGILVSTDVLAAVQNLQNAQYVVNYDFPWNPVVLIQRVGRIDRIGSPYDEVYLANVLPRNGDPEDPESLEYFLDLMGKLYRRLEMIRSTIGLDASTLGEEAAAKDFSIQERIAKNDRTVLDMLEKRIEQFTKDPIDVLAKIINEKGLDWVKSIPAGIGAVKDGEFDGVFALFTDGENFYWRLERFDNGETVTSPTSIVEILLSGGSGRKGERMPYDKIVPLLRSAKNKLLEELREQGKRQITLSGFVKPDKKVRLIYEALAGYGDEGERLAAVFRKVAGNKTVVDQLWRALQNGRLVDVAREILPIAAASNQEKEEITPEKLKRVCWCYIRKTQPL